METTTAQYQPGPIKIATERYKRGRTDIARLLGVLIMELDRHEKQTKIDPLNWRLTADLDLVCHDLINIVAFISGAKTEREDVERFHVEDE